MVREDRGGREIPPCGCVAPGVAEPGSCYCGVEDLLQIIRRRYSLSVLSAVQRLRRARYRDIAAALPGPSSSTLAETLQALVSASLLSHDELSEDPPVATYSITPSGRKLLKRLRTLLEDVQS